MVEWDFISAREKRKRAKLEKGKKERDYKWTREQKPSQRANEKVIYSPSLETWERIVVSEGENSLLVLLAALQVFAKEYHIIIANHHTNQPTNSYICLFTCDLHVNMRSFIQHSHIPYYPSIITVINFPLWPLYFGNKAFWKFANAVSTYLYAYKV